MRSNATNPSRRRVSKPLRVFRHRIEPVTLYDEGKTIVLLMRDGKQYYTAQVSKKDIALLANQWRVDVTSGDEEEE